MGAVIILIGSMSWAFGSVYGSRIELPSGMMAGAIEMLAAGIVLLIASMLTGETLTTMPDLSGFLAVGYLALFGSIIAINAYMFLIRNVSPAVATSYAYVNPVVAVLLGTGLGGETLSPVEWLALGVIVLPWCWSRWGNTCCPLSLRWCRVRWRNRKRMNALSVDLRGLTAAADPLFQPFGQIPIVQLQSAA